MEDEIIKKNLSKNILQGQKNMTIIKKRIRFDKKKTKERWNCKKKKKQLPKPS